MHEPSASRRSRIRNFFGREEPGTRNVDQQWKSTEISFLGPSPARSSHLPIANPSPASISRATIAPTVPNQDRSDLDQARDELWKAAYEMFREEQPEDLAAYEALIKEQSDLSNAQLLVPESAAIVVQRQREKLESKQWTYTWFGAPQKVRDNVESVLKLVTEAAGLISAGMTMAPVYVSLPWSMVSILIPFIMNDSAAMSSSVDGLKEIATIMACYSYAEKEFLTHLTTKNDFTDIVKKLYASILEYQASAAIYFNKSTLRRLGVSAKSSTSWADAISKTRVLDGEIRVALLAFDVKLTQQGLQGIDSALQQGIRLMQQISQAVSDGRVQRRQVTDWLSLINPYQDHTDVLRQLGDQYAGSGQWLLTDTETYVPWKRSDSDVVLLRGVMGHGKSSLTAMVIEDLLTTTTNTVAFAYCSDNASPLDRARTVRSDTTNILRCLLAQCAVLPDGTVARAAQSAYDRSSHQEAGGYYESMSSMLVTMREIISEHPAGQVTIVIDALDESKDSFDLMTQLTHIARPEAKVRIFMSARPGIDICPPFAEEKCRNVMIGSSTNTSDLRTYVDLEVSKRYESSGMSAAQAERLKAALIHLADGMFRWVVLEIDIFLPRSRKQGARQINADIERRLQALEASKAPTVERLLDAYDEVYYMAVGEPDEVSRRHCVQSAISWALCSFRPLTVEELVQAACVQFDGSPALQLDDHALMEYCSNFLIVTARRTIRLAHLSVRQFFESRKADMFSPANVHERAAAGSLSIRRIYEILPQLPVAVAHEDDPGLATTRNRSSSLAEYCALNWPVHWRLSTRSSALAELFEKVRGDYNAATDDLSLWTATTLDLAEQDTLGNTILHRAVYDRRMDSVDVLLHVATMCKETEMLDKQNHSGKSALHAAVLTKFPEAARLILVTAAYSTTMQPDHWGLTPLHLAVLADVNTIIAMAGADGRRATCSTAQQLGGNTILHFAAFTARPELARECLIVGFDPHEKNDRQQTADDIAAIEMDTLSAVPDDSTNTSGVLVEETSITSRHPHISIKAEQPCSVCCLEEWIGGSSDRKQFVVASTATAMSTNNLVDLDASTELQVAVTLDRDSVVRSGRDLIVYTVGDFTLRFELGISKQSSATFTRDSAFHGRLIVPSTLSDAIQIWREDCVSHVHCASAAGNLWPKTMIELRSSSGDFGARLRDSPPEAGADRRYVFLSFNWGSDRPLSLTKRNFAAFKERIDGRLLPPLHREAMMLAYQLGYHYIWIDALCIVQDDEEHWREAVAVMSEYIRHADIVFATATPGMSGSLRPAPRNTVCSFAAHLDVGKGGTEEDRFQLAVRHPVTTAGEVLRNNVLNRAWRLQEAILAERLVLFGQEQMYWSCGGGLKSQGTVTTLDPPIRTLSSFLSDQKRFDIPALQGLKLRRSFDYWYYLVTLNSRGFLQVATDRLPSIVALAAALQDYTRSEYCAGLWIADAVRGLLWLSLHAQSNVANRSRDSRHIARYIAPSWSWASRDGDVSYSLAAGLVKTRKGGVSKTHRFAVLEYVVPDTRVHSSSGLVPEGSAIKVSSHSVLAHELGIDTLGIFDYFFDDASDDFRLGIEERLVGMTLLLVAPWTYSPHGASRWAGLMVMETAAGSLPNVYCRKGVFLGPASHADLNAWRRRVFTIV
ncbi:hypothetical protein LTR22_000357 [Elasticomyces elasticus]|nr:hypothetical protein LTR22_000357 [Elasticomyces elasticus]KAK4924993.1 hypothetical protein LTR49_007999 [Elasticomyces elasticus]KAK5763250.1 hypothetical protein LTS12_006634 [Elasticomyces elasticus]